MKPPAEWKDEADLQALVAARAQESLELEYKDGRSLDNTEGKKIEISKDVSAFANSAGGTIVYGMSEDKHYPTGFSGIDPETLSKEWLEQVINSRIQRRIPDIEINQIWLKSRDPGKVVYAVNVPQSRLAPHQASDNRYYKRFNFQSIAMEDYEVRDVANRIVLPNLSVAVDLQAPTDLLKLSEAPTRIKARVVNNGGGSAECARIVLGFHDCWSLINAHDWTPSKGLFRDGNGSAVQCKNFRTDWRAHQDLPIWQGVDLDLRGSFNATLRPNFRVAYVFWAIFAPGVGLQSGYISWEITARGYRQVGNFAATFEPVGDRG